MIIAVHYHHMGNRTLQYSEEDDILQRCRAREGGKIKNLERSNDNSVLLLLCARQSITQPEKLD